MRERGHGYGIPGKLVDGMNVLDVYAAASEAISRAKRGDGPTLIECETYRYRGHGMYDTGLDYRTQEEINEWMRRDPIERLKQKLIAEKLASDEGLEAIRSRVGSRIEETVKFAQGRPYPPVEFLTKFVWT